MAQRVVVTGASSGIGAATATLFRERGWEVVAVARRAERLKELAERTGAEIFEADITDDDAVARLRDHLAATGPVHALINNAGGAVGAESVEEGSVDSWRQMFEINVLGTKRIVTALLPLLRASIDDPNSPGSANITTVTSTAARTPYEGGAGYNAAKAAESMLVQVLRLELAGEPIRVVEVAPGMVHTDEFSLTRFGGDQSKADAVYADVDHPLVADDIALTIVEAAELPWHVTLDLITMRPIAQAAQHKLVRGKLRVKS